MGSWLAAIYDTVTWPGEVGFLADRRRELVGGCVGRVLEIGAGTGANLPYYPPLSHPLVVAEPDPAMRQRLLARRTGDVRVVDWPAEALDTPDASIDVVVGTLVLCTVTDPVAAIREIRRVLVPGGVFRFLEHVAADGLAGSVQRALSPCWRHVAGRCELHRPTLATLSEGGFVLESVRTDRPLSMPPPLHPIVSGIARSP